MTNLIPVRMRHVAGFSLVELMVTLVLLGILTAVASSSFVTWMQDAKTRTVAESLQNGIRLAQNEALKRSRNVTFFLTSATPAMGAVQSTTGKNWVVESMTLADSTIPEVFIQGYSPDNVTYVLTTAQSAAIKFNSMGRMVSPANPVQFTVSNAKGSGRSLAVQVSIAGEIRMCDLSKTFSSTTPDGC